MKKVISFQRLNRMNESERKDEILGKYHYFQGYHDCLYCYETLEEINNDDSVYVLDANGVLVELVKLPIENHPEDTIRDYINSINSSVSNASWLYYQKVAKITYIKPDQFESVLIAKISDTYVTIEHLSEVI